MTSKEYVLRMMDRWYVDKVKDKYTEESEAEVMGSLKEKIMQKEDYMLGIDSYLSGFLGNFRREEQIKKASSYFSEAYRRMENFKKTRIEDEPEIILDDYMEPIIRHFKRLEGFVNKVRKVAMDKGPEDLTKEVIDDIFLDHFGSVEEYSKFCVSHADSAKYLLDLANSQGNITEEGFENSLKYIELSKEVIPYMTKQVFGDLKNKKG